MKKVGLIILVVFMFLGCSPKKHNTQAEKDLVEDEQQETVESFVEEAVQNKKPEEILVSIKLENPLYKAAFAQLSRENEKKLESLIHQNQGPFIPAPYGDADFPAELVAIMERALYDDNVEDVCNRYGASKFAISDEDFMARAFYYDRVPAGEYDKISAKTDYWLNGDKDEVFDENLIIKRDIFRFDLDADGLPEYLFFARTHGTLHPVILALYTVKDREFVERFVDTQNIFGGAYWGLIKYQGIYYAVFEGEGHMNTKGVVLYRFFIGKDGNTTCKQLNINCKRFDKLNRVNIYTNNNSEYRKSIDSYITNIKDIKALSAEEDYGHEDNLSDEEKEWLSPQAEENRYQKFSRVDFNNDGQDEYIRWGYWLSSSYTGTDHVEIDFYRINNDVTERLSITPPEITDDDYWSYYKRHFQWWFKKIDDKIFMFQLDMWGWTDYNLLLNTSLIEGNKITQIRNDIFIREMGFEVELNKEEIY